jgi:hypothetical protein
MSQLNETEKRIFSDLLDYLSQTLSNAGCNDYPIENTDEGKALWLEIENSVREDNGDPLLDKVPENQKDFWTFNWLLLNTLRKKLEL